MPDQAVAVSRETYRQGVGGMWIQFLVLFVTPFYWITSLLFRRSRLTTLGDYFTERFQSRFVGGLFAVFTLIMTFVGGGIGYMVAGKTMMAITPKTAEVLTVEERTVVEEFKELQELGDLSLRERTPEQNERYHVLNQKKAARGTEVVLLLYGPRYVLYYLRAYCRCLHNDGRIPSRGDYRCDSRDIDHCLFANSHSVGPVQARRVRRPACVRTGVQV